jgi:hypothetical protein
MHAYFHAQGISVMTGYPFYHWVMRETEDNASYEELEPVGYYQNVREVLDLIDEHMEPGPLRDRVKSHWYRGKMLGRVGGRNFLERDPDAKRPIYEEIRTLALERYGDEVEEYLAFNARVRSRLLRADDYEGLEALAGFEAELETEATVLEIEPEEEEAVNLVIESRISGLRFEEGGRWVPPASLEGRLEAGRLVADLDRSYADVLITGPAHGAEYLLRSDTEWRLDGDAVVLTTKARLQPRVSVAKADLRRGEWTVGVTAAIAGFTPPAVPAMHGRWPIRVPLVVTITKDGRVLPPTSRGNAARKFPAVARVLKKVG